PQPSHHDRTVAPLDLLVDIWASLFSTLRRLDALTVDHNGTGLGLPALLLPHGFDQRRVERRPQPAVAPAPLLPIHGLPRREVVGQQPPRLPTAYDRENGSQDLAARPGARAASG